MIIMRRRSFRKREGKAELVTGMFLLVFLTLLLAVHMQLLQFFSTSIYMEDALAASNLASAIIDIQEYGRSHAIRIASPEDAFKCYQEALKINLNLDEAWESENKELISGPVEIKQYIVYNVKDEDIEISSFGADGNYSYTEKGGLGTVMTPDGVMVESTSVYSRIGFPVNGILGVGVYAEKEKSVDVVSNE